MVNPKLVVVVGETASGKSALALELARKFNGEIISADSWQVYKGFDIGTAKPSQQEQAETPHHLIDIRQVDEGFSAALYKDLANQAIAEIAQRGKLPILVGGTGLYVDSVLYDFSFLPAGVPGLREKLAQKSIPELLTMLEEQGIDTVGIDTRNQRRLVRLLETGGQRPHSGQLRDNTLVMGLKLPRAKLRAQIEKRVGEMFRRGLKHEVKALADKYGWGVEPMKGIGYREFGAYFEGKQSLSETKRKIVRSTLELAKRQRTWFKRHSEITWVEGPKPALGLAEKFLSSV